MTLKFHFPINFNAVHNEFIRKSDGQPRFIHRRQCFTSILFASGGERWTAGESGRGRDSSRRGGVGEQANRNRKVRSGISVIHSIVNLIEPREIRNARSRKKSRNDDTQENETYHRDRHEQRNGWRINMIYRSLLIKLSWIFNWLKAALCWAALPSGVCEANHVACLIYGWRTLGVGV